MALHVHMTLPALMSTAILGIAMFAMPQPALTQSSTAHDSKPSRAPEKGCTWEKFSDAKLGLDAWVQRCTFGKRKIDFVAAGHSLAMRYSDSSGKPDPLIDVLDLLPIETAEHGLRRFFAAHTDKKLAARCVLAPYHNDYSKPPVGVKRYTFVPNATYRKELKRKEVPGDLPDPPCGDWGDTADGIQYFEAQPASGVAKVLFVRVGQDEPLFDDVTLRLR